VIFPFDPLVLRIFFCSYHTLLSIRCIQRYCRRISSVSTMAFPRFLNVLVLIYIGRAAALVADFSKGDIAISAAGSSESTKDLTVAPAAAVLAASSGWTLLGCYTDDVSARSLPYGAGVPGGPSAMTNELCQSTCLATGYILAGTEYSDECCECLSWVTIDCY
jgi:hypothetical protein